MQYVALAKEGGDMSKVKWGTSTLKKVGLLSQVNFDDAFAIVPIDRDVVHNFNFIMGVVPLLQEFIVHFQGKKIEKIANDEFNVSEAFIFCFLLLSSSLNFLI